MLIDMDFHTLLMSVRGWSRISDDRFRVIKELCERVNGLDGYVAEVGVYRGGSAKFIYKMFNPEKLMQVFDTFEGIPTVTEHDNHHKVGDFSDTDLEVIADYLKDCKWLSIYPGLFPDSTVHLKKNEYCFVHVDVDVYQSTKDACEFFYPRLVRGGILLCDDYGFTTCVGAKKAMDEYFAGKESIKRTGYNQGYIVKR